MMFALTPLFEYIIKSLVDKPELVEIIQKDQDATITLTIKVGMDDVGRIIGKDGQTIRALRSLALALVPQGQEVVVDIVK